MAVLVLVEMVGGVGMVEETLVVPTRVEWNGLTADSNHLTSWENPTSIIDIRLSPMTFHLQKTTKG